MDLWSALAVLRRRWIVFACGLMVVGGALAGVVREVPATYEAEGEFLLIVPAQKGAEAGQIGLQNPYLGFGGSLNIMTFILARSLGSQTAAKEVAEAGGNGEFVVDLVPGDAPIVAITSTSTNEQTTMSTYAIVEQRLLAELGSRQATAGAPTALRIVAVPVRTPIEPTVKNGSRIRAAAGIVVLGGALTLMLTFLAESFSNRRRGRTQRDAKGRHASTLTERDDEGDNGDDGDDGRSPGPDGGPPSRTGGRPRPAPPRAAGERAEPAASKSSGEPVSVGSP